MVEIDCDTSSQGLEPWVTLAGLVYNAELWAHDSSVEDLHLNRTYIATGWRRFRKMQITQTEFTILPNNCKNNSTGRIPVMQYCHVHFADSSIIIAASSLHGQVVTYSRWTISSL